MMISSTRSWLGPSTALLFQATLSSSLLVAAQEPAEPGASDVIAARVPRQETGFESDHLTGDWRGARSRMVERGLHFYAGYTGEVLANISGGLRRGAIYEGLFEAALDFETSKADWWQNGLFHLSSIYPHGSSLSAGYSGDLLTASNIDAYDSLRLYELWFQQTFAEGKLSIRFGQLLADEEFASTSGADHFINSAFGWPAFISGNAINTGPAFYVAAPGIRLRYEPDDHWFIQSGVYDGDTFDSPTGDPHVNASGTRVHFNGVQGLFWLSEAGLRLDPGTEDQIGGEYKLGGWLHTGDFVSNFHDRNGDPFIVSGLEPAHRARNFGAYLAANQMVWRDGARNASLFARVGGSPPDRSLFEVAGDAGFTLKGVIPRRLEDQFGLGAAYARISRDLRETERLEAAINGPPARGFSDYEIVLEAYYSAQLTKWWTLQPGFQWIFNPGGNSGSPDAFVIGLRSSVVF